MMPSGPGYSELAVEHHQRQQVAVPAVHEGDHRHRRENRPRQRQHDVAEEGEVAATVDQRGVEQITRQLAEVVA